MPDTDVMAHTGQGPSVSSSAVCSMISLPISFAMLFELVKYLVKHLARLGDDVVPAPFVLLDVLHVIFQGLGHHGLRDGVGMVFKRLDDCPPDKGGPKRGSLHVFPSISFWMTSWVYSSYRVPVSSIFWIRRLCVYRGGGWVSFSSMTTSFIGSRSPSFIGAGRTRWQYCTGRPFSSRFPRVSRR